MRHSSDPAAWVATGIFVLSTLLMLVSFRKPRRAAPKALAWTAFMSALQLLVYLGGSKVSVNPVFGCVAVATGLGLGVLGSAATKLVPYGGIIWSRNSVLYLLFWGITTALNQLRTCLSGRQGALSLGLAVVSAGAMVGSSLAVRRRYGKLRGELAAAPAATGCPRCGTARGTGRFCAKCGTSLVGALLLVCAAALGDVVEVSEGSGILYTLHLSPAWPGGEKIGKGYRFETGEWQGKTIPAACEIGAYEMAPSKDPREGEGGVERFNAERAARAGETLGIRILLLGNSGLAQDVMQDRLRAFQAEWADDVSGRTAAAEPPASKALGDACVKARVTELRRPAAYWTHGEARSHRDDGQILAPPVPHVVHTQVVLRKGNAVIEVLHTRGEGRGSPREYAEDLMPGLAARVQSEWKTLAEKAGIADIAAVPQGDVVADAGWNEGMTVILDQHDQEVDPNAATFGAVAGSLTTLLHMILHLILQGKPADAAVAAVLRSQWGSLPAFARTREFRKELLGKAKAFEKQANAPPPVAAPPPSTAPPAEPPRRVIQGRDVDFELKSYADMQYQARREREARESFLASLKNRNLTAAQVRSALDGFDSRIRAADADLGRQEGLLRALGLSPRDADRFRDDRAAVNPYAVGDSARQAAAGVHAQEAANAAQAASMKALQGAIAKMPPDMGLRFQTHVGRILFKGGPNTQVSTDKITQLTKISIHQRMAHDMGEAAAQELAAAKAELKGHVALTTMNLAMAAVPGGAPLWIHSAAGALHGAATGGVQGAVLGAFVPVAPIPSGLKFAGLHAHGAYQAGKEGGVQGVVTYLAEAALSQKAGRILGSAVSPPPAIPQGRGAIQSLGAAKEPPGRVGLPGKPQPSGKDGPLSGLDRQLADSKASATKEILDYRKLLADRDAALKAGRPTGELDARIRDQTARLNGNYQAKNILKHEMKGLGGKFDGHVQKIYRGDPSAPTGSPQRAGVDALFAKEMAAKGWTPQQIKDFRNASSRGTVGMDRDLGMLEPGPISSAKTHGEIKAVLGFGAGLGKTGPDGFKRASVHQWNQEAQEAYNRAYKQVTGQDAGSAMQSVTSSANPEAYRDLGVLRGRPGETPFSKGAAQQTADVTRFKANHLLNHPEAAGLTRAQAVQEALRGTAKDASSKLLPLLKGNPSIPQAQSRQLQAVTHILSEAGRGRMTLSQADAALHAATGGRAGVMNAHDFVANHIENAILFLQQ